MEELALEQQWFDTVTNNAAAVDAYDDVVSSRPTPQPPATTPSLEKNEDNEEMPSYEDSDGDGELMMFRLEMGG